jgi:hypothetical protein
MRRLALAGATAAMIASCGLLELAYADTALLNASYEPTRRCYSDLNKALPPTGRRSRVKRVPLPPVASGSHAPSGMGLRWRRRSACSSGLTGAGCGCDGGNAIAEPILVHRDLAAELVPGREPMPRDVRQRPRIVVRRHLRRRCLARSAPRRRYRLHRASLHADCTASTADRNGAGPGWRIRADADDGDEIPGMHAAMRPEGGMCWLRAGSPWLLFFNTHCYGPP